MPENFEFFGKKKDLPRAEQLHSDELKKGEELFEGELPKTPEQLEAIGEISKVLDSYFLKHGVETRPINPNRVHFLPRKIFEEQTNSDFSAMYNPALDAIYIDADASFAKNIFNLTHELVHAKSFRKNFVSTSKNEVHMARAGYSVTNFHEAYPVAHIHFEAFNEAIVQSIAIEALREKRGEIARALQLSQEEYKKLFEPAGYVTSQLILKDIIEMVSEKNDIPKEEFRAQLIKGSVTGEMHQLRIIEKTLGPGSLRVIAALNSNGSSSRHQMQPYNYTEMLKLFGKYISAENQKDRDIYAARLLNIRERLQYKNHVEKMSDKKETE